MNAARGWLAREEAIMGTAVRVELKHENRAEGEAAAAAVMQEMHRIDRLMSPFKHDSELSLINREAAQRAVPISREMYDLIRRSIEFSELSDGAFDITFSGVGCLYDYRGRISPSDAQVAQALPAIDYRHLRLDDKSQTIRFARAGVRIDLGGIAKGLAVDNCIALLKARGMEEALVSAGGDTRVIGAKDGRPWIIGIRDPRRPDEIVAKIPLTDAAISTSGDYERYFEAGGVRHHHIIDPRTGRSPASVRSVTVIGPQTTATEGLSKIVFVKGAAAGLALIDRLADFSAVVVNGAGQMLYSSALQRA